ncbi:metal-dependent hydrolase [Rhodohalobacter halophilus]|uniref:metal-dependent hydrolase n=1 Tax=Rhodohalobacter halophilus TaxID=1812810 RepID=UPI00083F64A0|nr:metal-dependent hydrolase [Rhodohalobacter halophilus]
MDTKIKAWWLGHSAFRLESPSGKVIYIDPFLSGNPTTPDDQKNPDDVDYILLTHGHEDHVGDTLDIAKKTGCKVVAQVELSHLLKKHGLEEDQRVEFNKGGTIHFDDFSVTLVDANHSSSFKGEYAGEAGGLIISFEDDICFYHLGDTNVFGDLELYGDMYQPHVVAVPIGDYYTMGPQEAAICVDMLQPKIAVPIHYGTFPVLTGDPEEFKEFVAEYSEADVQMPKPGDQFLG